MKSDKRMTYKNEYGEWCVKSTEAQNIAITNANGDKYYTGAPIDHLAELEDKIESGELKECGGEDCPNFKHYQAECKRCTKKMEVKKSLEIESAVQQAVKEFAEKLKEVFNSKHWAVFANAANKDIDNLITELYGADE